MLNPMIVNELDEINQMPDEQRQQFQITDLSSLNWALRKMSAITAKRNEVDRLADSEIERIEAYRQREHESLERSYAFFQELVAKYALQRRIEDEKYKGDKTPYGKVSFRKTQPKWTYEDDKLITFLHQNGYNELIRVKEEPIKTEIKKKFVVNQDGRVIDENGQIVEGVSVEFLPDTIDVKVES